MFVAILSILALSPSLAHAQQPADACDRLPKLTVPEQDKPTLPEALALVVPLPRPPANEPLPANREPPTACDAAGLYYSHVPAHFQKARSCVLATLGLLRGAVGPTQIKLAQEALTGGATAPADILNIDGLVLAMVYANGEGVGRNLPLARQFLCEYSGGIQSDEPSKHLQDFDDLIRTGGRLDVCDGGGGSFGRQTNYVCLGLKQGSRDEEIHRLELAVLASSAPQIKASFLALRVSWRAFHDAYDALDAGICDGGTGCGPITEGDDLNMTESWLTALQALRAGKAPASAADPSKFSKLDHALNVKYQENLNEYKADDISPDCCTAQVRAAGRAWLKYREAWVRFGALRWPALPADQWRAWQTAEWLDLLF